MELTTKKMIAIGLLTVNGATAINATEIPFKSIAAEGYFGEVVHFIEQEPKTHGVMDSYINLDLTTHTKYSANELEKYLRFGLDGLGVHFKEAEKKYNVNAMFLMAVATLESNHGRSSIAKTNNNLFGFSSYDKNPSKYSAKFKSKKDSIDKVAKYISINYLSPNGKYYKGKTVKDVNYYYCSQKDWYKKVNEIMTTIDWKIKKES